MLVVVGGHSRNIGKTSVVAGIIHALPQWNWTAMKITQFGHGICSSLGEPCDCSLETRCSYSIAQEQCPSRSDTGRFVAAGARESYWVRTAIGQLVHAVPAVREICAASQNLIIESNSIVEFLRPDVYLVVLDVAQPDFKASSRRFLNRADACVVIDRDGRTPTWNGIASADWRLKPQFLIHPPEYVTPSLAAWVDARLHVSSAHH